MTIQIAVKLPDDLVEAVDRLVTEEQFENRSAAVRAALRSLLHASRSQAVDRAFAEGFARLPEDVDEMRQATDLAVDAIEAEPWEKWW